MCIGVGEAVGQVHSVLIVGQIEVEAESIAALPFLVCGALMVADVAASSEPA